MAEFEKRQAEAAEKQREKEKLLQAELERQEKERQTREAKRISAMQEAIRCVSVSVLGGGLHVARHQVCQYGEGVACGSVRVSVCSREGDLTHSHLLVDWCLMCEGASTRGFGDHACHCLLLVLS
jgi:hypothetical protein